MVSNSDGNKIEREPVSKQNLKSLKNGLSIEIAWDADLCNKLLHNFGILLRSLED